MNSSEDLDALMRKYSGSKTERDMLEYYTELYACLQTLQKLERAYSRGVFSTPEEKNAYEIECKSLIAQCRSNHDCVRDAFPDIEKFVDTYKMSCKLAVIRLQRGLPATLEHFDGGANAADRQTARAVTEATEAMISLMNNLQLGGQVEVEAIKDPLMYALNSLRNVDRLVPKLKGREKMNEWSAKIAGMRVVDALSDAERREFFSDVNAVYGEFKFAIEEL